MKTERNLQATVISLLTADKPSAWQGLAIGACLGIVLALVGSATTPWIILIGIICLVLLVSAFISPSAAFLMVVACIPIERIGRLTEDTAVHTISIIRIAGLLALASLLFHNFLLKRKFHFGTSFLLYSGYILCCLFTLLYTDQINNSLRVFGMMAGNLLFLFLVSNTVRSWPLAKLSIILWLIVSVSAGIYTAYDWHFGTAVEPERVGTSQTRFGTVYIDSSEYAQLNIVKRAMGPTSMPGAYGINMILTIPFFFLMLRIQKTTLRKTVVCIGFAIVLYNIFLTNTRATLLVALCALVFCGCFKLFRINLRAIALMGGLLIVLLPLVPSEVYLRMLTASNYTMKNSETLAARVQYWKAALRLAQDHWLAGIGIGNEARVADVIAGTSAPERISAHNEFIATFLELGLLGWLLFIGFLATVIRTIRKTACRLKMSINGTEPYWFLNASMVATLSVMLYGLQTDVFHTPLKGWWLVAGLSIAISRIESLGMTGGSKSALAAPAECRDDV